MGMRLACRALIRLCEGLQWACLRRVADVFSAAGNHAFGSGMRCASVNHVTGMQRCVLAMHSECLIHTLFTS